MLFMLQTSPTTTADSENSFNFDDDDTFLDDEDDDGVREESGLNSTKQPTRKKQKNKEGDGKLRTGLNEETVKLNVAIYKTPGSRCM
jgi:hypothetical protein